MTAAAVFEERSDPGRIASALLAAAVQGLLLLILVFGVRWQNRPPETVEVELWQEPVAVEIPAEPQPLPKVEPAPLPVVEPEPVMAKPEIIEKKAPPPKPIPKVAPKPKPEPPKVAAKPRDEEAQRQIRDQLTREQAALAIDRERQQITEAARNRGLADYEARIRNKVRGNIVLPPDLQGNPEVVLLVVQLPTGEVLSVKLVKSSGHRGYDESVERALLKSSPLPRPDRPELFSRELKLTFRPRD